jgi:hypothetical protein
LSPDFPFNPQILGAPGVQSLSNVKLLIPGGVTFPLCMGYPRLPADSVCLTCSSS